MTKVLIAVDETPESVAAARAAHGLFGDTGVEYLVASIGEPPSLVSALDPMGISPVAVHRIAPPSKERFRAIAAEAAAAADLADAEVVAEIGPPGPRLSKLAQDLGVDVLVIGDHERGFLSRLLEPSVKSYLVDHAPCPVLVVR